MKIPAAGLISAVVLTACTAGAGAPTTTTSISIPAPTTTSTTAPPTTTTTSTTAPPPTTTTTAPPPTTTTLDQTVHPPAACRLPDTANEGHIGSGFPRPADRIPPIGTVNAAVLFADFDDVPATMTPEDVFAMVSPGAQDYFATVSYGRMELILQPHLKWLRLREPSATYGDAVLSFDAHRAHLQEAMDLADHEVDFSDSDLVVVLNNPNADAIPYGPTFTGFSDPVGAITADGALITNGVTSGVDLSFWGFLWLNHEMGHSMGLVDLYSYEGLPGFTGEFSLMNDIAGEAPEYLAYERWLLGWLDDDQIVCQADDRVTALTPIEAEGGTKAVILPIGDSRSLVVESRRALGYDSALQRTGALVYTLDSAIPSGFGPIEVTNEGQTLQERESVTVDGYTVTVLASGPNGDTVQVSENG